MMVCKICGEPVRKIEETHYIVIEDFTLEIQTGAWWSCDCADWDDETARREYTEIDRRP